MDLDMNVIFLDIDGVLNVENYLVSLVYDNENGGNNIIHDKYGRVFCPTTIRYLKSLINKHNAKLVISSTWRNFGIDRLNEMWKHRNLPGEIYDTTCSKANHNFKQQYDELSKIIDIRFSTSIKRGFEIQAYLNLHPEIQNYVIFDDDNDMLEQQLEHFVHCDPMYGIDSRCYAEADLIFSKP